MRLPVQSVSIRRNASVQLVTVGAIYPTQAQQFIPNFGGLHFCYGWDDDFNRCRLYLGTQQACASLTPCIWPFFQATRVLGA
jgi:hypothetical protein